MVGAISIAGRLRQFFPPPIAFRVSSLRGLWVGLSPSPQAAFLFGDRMREKRSEKLQTHVGHSIREQLELFRAERGNVVSMSDYLHEVIEEHIALREAMRRSSVRISQQRIGRRVGNQ